MRRVSSLVVLLVACLLALGSCGKATEKLTEKAIEESAGGGDVDIDDDGSFSFENDEGSFSVDEDGNVKIEGEDGEFSIDGSSGELPDGFPDDVPVPDGLDIITGSKTSDGEQTIYAVFGNVAGDPDEVFADIIAAFEDDGYDTEGKSETNSDQGFFATATFVGRGHRVATSVSTEQNEGGATVSINVTPDES